MSGTEKWLGIALGVWVAACAHRPASPPVAGGPGEDPAPGEATLRLLLPLAEPLRLDPAKLIDRWEDRWGLPAGLRAIHEWSDPRRTERRYRLSDGTHAVVILVRSDSLPGNVLARLLASAPGLGDAGRRELRGHRGHIEMSLVSLPETRAPLGQARFLAKALQVVAGREPVLGCFVPSAWLYLPRAQLPGKNPGEALEASDLRRLFVRLLPFDQPAGRGVHTVGMEAFGLPDLRIRVTARHDAETCASLLEDVVQDVLSGGADLGRRDAGLLLGTGLRFAVRQVSHPRHPTGRFGTLELEPLDAGLDASP